VFKSGSAGIPTDMNSFPPPTFFRVSSSHYKKTYYQNRGFSLVELIVVIVLLGLMFGIAVPNFREAMLTDSLDNASLNIIGLVQDLRERAVSDQIPYILNFDIPEKKMWAFPSNATDEERETAQESAAVLPDDVIIQDVWTWASGKQYNDAAIRFNRKGYIEQSVIHLQSEDGRELSLELAPFLGSIKIHEGYLDHAGG
jgi:prepilin-type N-terminal cleavage/methylation domain-containing protein